jgi:hypothetical protein
MNKPWLLVLIFVGIFATGVVTGGFVSLRYARGVVQEKVTEKFVMWRLKQFGGQLQLTKEQRERIRPILVKGGDQIRELQKDVAAIRQQMDDDVKKELSETQRLKFDEIEERLRNEQKSQQEEKARAWQRWLKEQRNNPPAPVEGAPKP